jgi:hypothetical protein
MTSTDVVSYAYGVVAEERLPETFLAPVRTVAGGRSVRVVASAGVGAVVSDVPAHDFRPEALRARLEDVGWLEENARAHEDVLERVLSATAVVPFRFCTIYETDADVRRYLAASAARLRDLLARLDGRVELGVKAFADDARLGAALRGGDVDAPAGDGAGRAYLLRRGRDLEIAAERSRFLARCAAAAHRQLTEPAVEARLLRPQPPELSGRADTMFLNAAYLVDSADALERALGTLERRYGRHGVSFELTGPWPAYNFVPADPSAA